MAKVNISIDDELLERIDSYADSIYTSRSGLISLGVSEWLNAKETMLLVKNLSIAIQKIADTGVCDDDTMKEIEDFERLAKLISRA